MPQQEARRERVPDDSKVGRSRWSEDPGGQRYPGTGGACFGWHCGRSGVPPRPGGPEEEPLQTVVETNPTGDTAETEPPSGEIQRKAAYLEVLDHAGDQAMYARLIDMDGDGTEELLLFGQYRWAEADEMDWGFTAYTWDGAVAQSVDLARGGMMIDCSAYGVYRDSTTGEIYVHYYSGMDEDNDVFLSLTDRVRLRASSDPDAAQEYGMAIGGGTSGYDG